MQHVSTYNSHLQAKLRTVIALQGGCAYLGSHMAYSVFASVFFIHNVTYNSIVNISHNVTYNSIVNISHNVTSNSIVNISHNVTYNSTVNMSHCV
jgi:hypothetical protein